MTLIKTEFYIPYNPKLKERARVLRKNPTEAEEVIWYQLLRDCKFQFYRQKIIDNFIVDFYCPKQKLVIEIDGESHYSEDAKSYDQKRTEILESYGIKVLRFTNEQVLNNINYVRKVLESSSAPKGLPLL
ncbi:MAG: endonuclease domain-containing protein [Candidatus Caenarcaniphilales bacterium]|nr:endonuclease domain-containing protein [Candidatus Caenarcaniphilales bacterium]